MKKKFLTLFLSVCVVAVVLMLCISCSSPQSTPAPKPAPSAPTPSPTPAPAPAPTQTPASAPAPTPTQTPAPAPAPKPASTPAPAPTPTPAPTPAPSTKYTPPCKVITAEDIASVLGVPVADVTELPDQPTESACIDSYTVKINKMPAPVAVTCTETKITPLMMSEPKVVLANTKKMVAANSPSLGIGDYDSFEMVGGTVMFGKGKYMVQVSCPMNIPMEKTIAIAKLVAQHM